MTLPLKDLLRHLWHLLGGMALPLVYLYWPDGPVPVAAAALAIGALCLEWTRLRRPALNDFLLTKSPVLLKEKERDTITGSTCVLIGTAVAIGLFPRPEAIVAVAFMAIGDAAAALVGKTLGRHKILNETKSVEGTIACFVACSVVALALGVWSLGLGVGAALAGAAAATVIELFSFHVDDNVLMPVACAGMMWGFTML